MKIRVNPSVKPRVKSSVNLPRVKQTRRIYQGRIFDIVKSRLVLSHNRAVWREVVVHQGAATLLPLLPGNRIILVKQFRYPAKRYLWELPAGTIEQGETPLACARRELVEETGFSAQSIRKVTEFYTCPGFCTEKIHLYLARNLKPAKCKSDPDEDIKHRVFSRREIVKMLKHHKIIDAKTLIGLMLWLRR